MNRKWFQFNLKTLLLVVLIFALPLAWLGYERYAYYVQWKDVLPVLAQLKDQQAVLIYGNESNVRSEKPEWIRRLVGDIYPERILGVAFQGNCPAETLALLPRLNSLNIQIVMFDECQLKTSGLKYLCECEHLKRVKLVGGILSGTEFKQVFLVPELKTLRLEKVPITSRDLSTLDEAKHLEVLQLSGIALDPEDIKRIGRLPKLRDLWLNEDLLSSLAGLNDMTTLESLDMTGSNVSDRLLPELERLPNLSQLILSQTLITTASIPSLARFPKLEFLVVDKITLGPTELAALKSMPKLHTVLDSSGTIKIKP